MSAVDAGHRPHRRADAVAGDHQVGRLVALGARRVADAHAGDAVAVAQQAHDLLAVPHGDALGEDRAHAARTRRPGPPGYAVAARRDLPGDGPDGVEHPGVVEGVEAVVRAA